MGKTFNKGLSEDDKNEGLFKRLKKIEISQKNLIRDDDNAVFTTHLNPNLVIKMINIYKKTN